MKWYYYLHTNGDLIGKNPAVVDGDPFYFDSDFVKKVWAIDTDERGDCWEMILEALALGACIDRVKELAGKWRLDKADAVEMIVRVKPTPLLRKGIKIFAEEILGEDIEAFWSDLERLGIRQ